MSWFSKPKINKDSELFLSEFPSWVSIHSAKLVNQLQTDERNGWSEILRIDANKSQLTDFLIGAHLFYLNKSAEGGIVISLFGNNILERSLFLVPEQAKVFYFMANTTLEKQSREGKNGITSLLEDFYKIKIDPLDATVAFVADNLINDSKDFSAHIGELLPTLNQLCVEQLRWIKEMIKKVVKK
jgi:hypothetical protein